MPSYKGNHGPYNENDHNDIAFQAREDVRLVWSTLHPPPIQLDSDSKVSLSKKDHHGTIQCFSAQRGCPAGGRGPSWTPSSSYSFSKDRPYHTAGHHHHHHRIAFQSPSRIAPTQLDSDSELGDRKGGVEEDPLNRQERIRHRHSHRTYQCINGV